MQHNQIPRSRHKPMQITTIMVTKQYNQCKKQVPFAEKKKKKKEEHLMPEPLAVRKLCFTRSHRFASPARTHGRTESNFPWGKPKGLTLLQSSIFIFIYV